MKIRFDRVAIKFERNEKGNFLFNAYGEDNVAFGYNDKIHQLKSYQLMPYQALRFIVMYVPTGIIIAMGVDRIVTWFMS